MSSIGTGYDLYTSTFSPDGRIFQVEYAFKAVDASGTTIGLRCHEGVVLAVEKIIQSKMTEPYSNPRICNVDDHIGFASAGIYPDSRALAGYCIEQAQNYYNEYRCKITPKYMADRVSMYVHAYTLSSGVRPFGCSALLAGQDPITKKPYLYMLDPSGLSYGYFGIAVGRNKQSARTEIEKIKLNDMSLEELVKAATKIIYTVRDETKDKKWELEMSWIGTRTNGKHELVPRDLVKKAEDDARRALDEDESDEEMRT